MSQQLSSAFIASFSDMTKHAYQGAGKLAALVKQKNGVVGSTHKFFKMGKGLAQPRTPQTDVVPMNIAHTSATATLSDWSAAEYTDLFDQQKVSFNERQELAKTVAMAMGRRKDQLIINAMNASNHSTSVDATGGFTTAKILETKRVMDDLGVPMEDRYFAMSAYALEEALSDAKIGSEDYNILKPIVAGELKKWGGFEYVFIETRDEGGLPLASTTRSNFAFHKDAIGLATGIDMRVEVNYVPEKTSWLVNGLFSAGAVTIDTEGVIKVTTSEA